MTIEKHGNKYRISQMYEGKRYRVTVDHKPTNAEAMILISNVIGKQPTDNASLTLSEACEAYINAKSNVLSPTTIREYRRATRHIPDTLARKHLHQITFLDVQKFINDYSATRSPKTTANMSNFVTSVLKSAGVDIGTVKLPQKKKKTPYIPSTEEVQRILREVEGTKYEIPIKLAIVGGLRRSEICALTLDDLNGNVLTINKAKVQNENKEWVIKATKTTDSTRTIVIPDDLADQIREQGYIYEGHPELIYRALCNAEKKAGIPHFPLHKLRHFYASYLHDLGTYSDKQIQAAGGWKTDSVMKTVYTHAMEMEKAKRKMASDFGAILGQSWGNSD